MKLYAVRYIEDKAMVGLFYVRRLADIVVQIDAETDPRECEWQADLGMRRHLVW